MMVHSGVDVLTHDRFNSNLLHNHACGCSGEVLDLKRSCAAESKKKDSKSMWSSFFSSLKRSGNQESSCNVESAHSDDTARFVNQLASEGRSAENIAVHLAHLRDVDKLEQQQQQQQQKKEIKRGNSFISAIKSIHNALKEEFALQQTYMYTPPPTESRFLTVSISVAPFYAAPPPDRDISFDELASIEPVYNNNQCINLLPVTKYDGTPLPGDQTMCAICLGDFEKNEELKSLHCVHFYHKECIDSWLRVAHNCPVCKALVL